MMINWGNIQKQRIYIVKLQKYIGKLQKNVQKWIKMYSKVQENGVK